MAAAARRIIVPFAPEDLRLIEDFRHARRIASRAGAIRRLVRIGAASGDGRPDLARALAALRRHRAELARLGVAHAAVFGSLARGDARPDSDIDVLIELDRRRMPDLFAYAGIRRRLGEILPGADVVEKGSLHRRIARRALEEAVHAF